MNIIPKVLLQELLNETQSEMTTYHKLSDKKKRKRKIMEAYRHLRYRELSLKEAIEKHGGDKL